MIRLAVGAAFLLAAASLALPYFPVYDPWAWLVWGRQLVEGGLETAAGPSWKPLPVLVDAPLSLLGDAAPKAWLLIARSGWICAPLLAGLLAARLSGAGTGSWRWVAAAVAAGSVALTGDAFTPPLRQFTGGLSEPLLVALVLGAVWAALDERPGVVLVLGTLAALLRPETWPFLALWAFLALREHPRLRLVALAVGVLVPLAWFVPDIVGAGNPLEGGETARGGGIEPLDGLTVLGRTLAAPLAAAWVGVVLLLWRIWPAPDRGEGRLAERDRPLAILLAGAGGYVVLVALMAVGGFAGLPRFLAPATAIVAIAGAVGIARAAASVSSAPKPKSAGPLSRYTAQRSGGPFGPVPPRALVAAALVLAVVGFGWRGAQVPEDLRVVERQTSSLDGLFELVDRTGSAPLLACGGKVKVMHALSPTALAWKLGQPISAVALRWRPLYGIALSTRTLPRGVQFARAGRWRATRLPCPSGYSEALAGGSG